MLLLIVLIKNMMRVLKISMLLCKGNDENIRCKISRHLYFFIRHFIVIKFPRKTQGKSLIRILL